MQKSEKELKLISIKIYQEDFDFLKNKLKNRKSNVSIFIRELIRRTCENSKKMEPSGSIVEKEND